MPRSKKRVCRCKVCGRALRNAESIARGMGPTCEKRVIGVVSRINGGRAKRPTIQCEFETISLFPLGEDDE